MQVSRLSAAPRAPLRAASRRAIVVRAQAQATRVALPRWPDMYQILSRAKLETVSPEDAVARIESGKWVLIDVRLKEQHEKGHPEGAKSVPMYETIGMDVVQGGDFRKMLKAFMYKSNGVNPVDPNSRFVEQLLEATDGGKKGAIVMCEAGGTMRPSINFPEGKASRSLQAAYRIHNEKLCSGLAHLDRGVYGWYQSDLPMNGEYTPDVGRTPMAAAEPSLRRLNQEKGYDMREGDKPVENKKLWPW